MKDEGRGSVTVRLTFDGDRDIAFPGACVVCAAAAERDYTISRSLTIGNATYTLEVPVPLCSKHYEAATRQNPAERLVARVGSVVGGVAGLAVLAALLVYWAATGQAVNVLTALIAAFVGAGIGLALWALLAFFVAPLFGDPDSKAVRSAVRIRHYWPADGAMQLEFAERRIADLVAEANPGRVLARK
jgi:hypothetical protein